MKLLIMKHTVYLFASKNREAEVEEMHNGNPQNCGDYIILKEEKDELSN